MSTATNGTNGFHNGTNGTNGVTSTKEAFEALPPFPEDIHTHPLLVVDYQLIKAGDKDEIDKLWKAATELGFWYLKNHGVEHEVDGMFDMGLETMKLPLEEKIKFEQGDEGRSFGYKAAGVNATDYTGAPDTVEFLNVSKDDALAYPTVVHRTYPAPATARMESTIKPFVSKSVDVTLTLISVIGERLGFPKGTLEAKHKVEDYSGSEARFILNPPQPGVVSEEKKAIGAHTDFGSLSFLHNRLGGLQVLVPGTEDWQFVRPIPGHAICNLGDAMTIFSGGILRSNLHRVIPPPAPQNEYPRTSLVFFIRPSNDTELAALTSESELVKARVDALGSEEERSKYFPGSTAAEWFARRVRNQRLKNRKGAETWWASRGMEHKVTAA